MLTRRLQLLATSANSLLIRAFNQLDHSRNGMLITPVDCQEHTLERQVLVQRGVGLLSTARSRKAEELRQGQEVLTHGPLSNGIGLLLDLLHGVGLLLLKPLNDIFLEPLLLGVQASAVVGVDLLVLGELLLHLGDLGLQAGLLEDLGLLVGVDNAVGDELVEGLSGMFGEERIRSGGVDLRGIIIS